MRCTMCNQPLISKYVSREPSSCKVLYKPVTVCTRLLHSDRTLDLCPFSVLDVFAAVLSPNFPAAPSFEISRLAADSQITLSHPTCAVIDQALYLYWPTIPYIHTHLG